MSKLTTSPDSVFIYPGIREGVMTMAVDAELISSEGFILSSKTIPMISLYQLKEKGDDF